MLGSKIYVEYMIGTCDSNILIIKCYVNNADDAENKDSRSFILILK